ncbi:MAG TPA: hypothetical protein DER09_06140 [Prolixibacteraceae bacterium]|nr:hypothetical protein [Prolixibacteraceae bacterium]
MTFGKQILLVITGIIYFISSTGIVVYKTNCSCFENEQVSVYITPETCDTQIHKHHTHTEENSTVACCAHECHECSTTEKNCGCQSPEAYFFKLIDPVVNEDVLFVKVQSLEIKAVFTCLIAEILFETEKETKLPVNTGPPPLTQTSFDFLIQIHQLKIPTLA